MKKLAMVLMFTGSLISLVCFCAIVVDGLWAEGTVPDPPQHKKMTIQQVENGYVVEMASEVIGQAPKTMVFKAGDVDATRQLLVAMTQYFNLKLGVAVPPAKPPADPAPPPKP